MLLFSVVVVVQEKTILYTKITSESQLWYDFSALVVYNNVRDECITRLFSVIIYFRTRVESTIIVLSYVWTEDLDLTINVLQR